MRRKKCRSSSNTDYWRKVLPEYTDDQVRHSLEGIWAANEHRSPPYDSTYHDWTFARAATSREARRRGLSLAVTGLGP